VIRGGCLCRAVRFEIDASARRAASAAECRPHPSFVRAGALGDHGLKAPEATIWTDRARHRASISDDIPRHPTQIPPLTPSSRKG
jgi:hypothetical protein